MSNNIELYYQEHIFICVNLREKGTRQCCAKGNSAELHEYMKKRCKELDIKNIRVNKSLCLDRCELGPIMVIYPQGIWYHFTSKEDIDEIIEEHFIKKTIATRLIVK